MLLGNLAFIAAWGLALTRPAGWRWIGPVLLGVFLALRVGGMWLHALRNPDGTGRTRRAAVLTTGVALLATALWVYTVMRGPR